MPTSLIVPIVGAAAGKAVGGLFGGDAPSTAGFTPAGINAGGLRSTFGDDGTIGITADANRMGLVNNIANTFGKQADQIGALRPLVAPGVSDLRKSRLGQVESARLNAIGNLRENLGRRRVLGSSFAQDAATRAEAEFSQQKQAVEAESFMQELETTVNLMREQFTARRGQFQTGLDEMNLEANMALSLAGKATDVLAKNAQIDAMLSAQNDAAAGKFAGSIGEQITKGLTGAFGGAGGGVLPGGLPLGKGGIGSA